MKELEVCLDSSDFNNIRVNVARTFNAGAHRIELCHDLSNGGTTPSLSAIQIARSAFGYKTGLLVMIRPRAGNFVYSKESLETMINQIELAAKLGANGVVLGALNPANEIDFEAMARLMNVCKGLNLSVTFHRAFDQVEDRAVALELLIELGVDRILTSGTPWGSGWNAWDGLDEIKRIVCLANNRIEIVVGGGINPTNIEGIHQQLPDELEKVSFHSNSGAHRNSKVDPVAIKEMLKCIS